MITQTLKKLPELALLGCSVVAGLVFFALTNPSTLPPAALMLGFLVLFGVTFSVVMLIMRLLGLKERLPRHYSRGVAVGIAALPVLLLAMQSLGQLTLRDTITLGVLYVTGYFYLSRMAPLHKKD